MIAESFSQFRTKKLNVANDFFLEVIWQHAPKALLKTFTAFY